jgi:YVTN family beta-propeller protein
MAIRMRRGPVGAFRRPRAAICFALAAGALLCAAAAALGEAPPPATGGTRGPMQIVFARDGSLAYVAEVDAGDVAVIDVPHAAVLGHISTGGEEPTALALLPDDRTLLVSNSFSGSLGFIDLVRQRLVGTLPLRGGPADVVVSPDGERAYVSLSQLDQVAVIDLERRKERARVPVGHRPGPLAITPNGRRVACANIQSGDISVIDADFLTELRRLRTRGSNLRGMALVRAADLGLASDAVLAMVSCQVPNPQGQATQVENGQIWSNFVEAIPLDGLSAALVPGGGPRPPQFRGADVIGETWLDTGRPVLPMRPGAGGPGMDPRTGTLFTIAAQERETLGAPPDVPHGRQPVFHAAADPCQVVLLPNQNVGFVLSAGIHAVSRFNLIQTAAGGEETWDGAGFNWQGRTDRLSEMQGQFGGLGQPGGLGGLQSSGFGGPSGPGAGWGGIVTTGQFLGGGEPLWSASGRLAGAVNPALRQNVGLDPRCLAVAPDRERVWVANHLGNSISVLNGRTMKVERTIDLGPARPDPGFAGRVLFNDAFATKEQWFSCNSCHTDGMVDGRSWRFGHVPDGLEGLRNTRLLRGGIQQTAPFRWSGHEQTLEQFAQDEVTGLLKGQPRAELELKSLAYYLAGLRLPPNPHRNADGSFTLRAAAGRALFLGKAGCAGCHAGTMAGGTGKKAWVGTLPEERLLDVPHLVGVSFSAPYLHDGRAATLEDIFRRHNPAGHHGNAAQLTDAELEAVLEYVREL